MTLTEIVLIVIAVELLAILVALADLGDTKNIPELIGTAFIYLVWAVAGGAIVAGIIWIIGWAV